jgi:predicted negative regulator of RcsB-dependent stress response
MFNKKIIVISVFIIIGALIYSSSINSSFHLDDFRNIPNNPDITINQLSLGTLKNAAFTDSSGFRPVAYLSFALNYYFSGKDTTSYHVVNVLIHIINAFLIYLVILKLFSYSNAADDERLRISVSAFFTALFWLVAPFNSQAVIYVVQRMTLLMTLFLLLSFLYYLKGREEKKTALFILSVIFFFLSFFSKQNALVFPLIVMLYELVFVRKGDFKSISSNEKVLIGLIIVILILPLIIFRSEIDLLFTSSGYTLGFTYYERELTQFRVLIYYISLMILPLPSRLSLTHDIIKSTSLFSPVTTFFSIIFILALFVFSILRIKKSPYFSFAILWYFITMSVEAIIPIGMMFEHRMYLPSIFLIGAAVSYVTEKFYGKRKRVVISAFLALIIVWGSFTAIRGKVWESEFTIWSDVVKKYPKDARGLYQLGNAQIKRGRMDLAEMSYLKSIDYARDVRYQPYFKLGLVLFQKGDYEKAKWNFKKAVDIGPEFAENHLNLGTVYFKLKDYDNALRSYNEALKLRPKLAIVHIALGEFYKSFEDYDKAADYFKKALEYDPDNMRAMNNLFAIEKYIKK